MAYLPNVPPNAPADYQNAILNQVIDTINAQQRTQTQNDGTSTRFLQGYQSGGFPGGDFGIKISPAGVDVQTAALAELLFYWDFTTGTMYWNYNGRNYRQDGILPDGVGGQVIMKPGYNVSEAF